MCRAAAVVRGVPYDDEREQARAWFWSLGLRLAARYHRRMHRRPLEFRDPVEVADMLATPSAEALVTARAELARFDAAFAELTAQHPDFAAIVEAYHLNGEQVREAAERLGVNPNTAHNRLRLGRNALRAALRRGEA